MSADLAVQKAIRARLVAVSGVTSLVPAASILDRNARPAPDPSIIIGEGQSIDADRMARNVQQVFATLHAWKKEPSTAGVKAISGAVRTAIHSATLEPLDGFTFTNCHVSSTRFMRDPDGETSHAVITVEAFASEG